MMDPRYTTAGCFLINPNGNMCKSGFILDTFYHEVKKAIEPKPHKFLNVPSAHPVSNCNPR